MKQVIDIPSDGQFEGAILPGVTDLTITKYSEGLVRIYGLPSFIRLETIGNIIIGGFAGSLKELVCKGCIIEGDLPTDLESIQLDSTYIDPTNFLPCNSIKSLYFINMKNLSEYIPLVCWLNWKHSMISFVDEVSMSENLKNIMHLQKLKRLVFTSGNFDKGPYYHNIYVADGAFLDACVIERTILYHGIRTKFGTLYASDCIFKNHFCACVCAL